MVSSEEGSPFAINKPRKETVNVSYMTGTLRVQSTQLMGIQGFRNRNHGVG